MAYIPIELLKCVVFVGYENAEGKRKLAGSAFWISRPGANKDHRPAYLVTAAHVIEQIRRNAPNERVRVHVNTTDGAQKSVDTPVQCWHVHPDPAVDIAILKIGLDDLDHFAWPTEAFVTEQSAKDDGRKIELGDELFLAGLFWPHTGEKRNIPIVRLANVAALRGEPVLNRDGQLMDAYLVESRSIGGLSGSPVFVDVLAAKAVFQGDSAYIMGEFPSKYRLVGVMHGHFEGSDAEPNTVIGDSKTTLGVNMGIAMVIPAEKIFDVLTLFDKEEASEAATAQYIAVGNTEPQTNTTAQVTGTGFTIGS